MSTDKSFRGTLLLLQNKTKRDPESYRDEFLTQLKHFDAVTKTLLSGVGPTATASRGGTMDAASASNPQFLAVLHYVANVAHCYGGDCSDLPERIIALLQQGKESLPSDTRGAFVTALLLLRNKNIASAEQTLPVLFELLASRDKSLRKVILSHIVSDVRRINLPGSKAGSAAVNKHVQNFLFAIMDQDDQVQARSALLVMLDLYRRQIWSNEKTVSVIARACFSRHTAILRIALHFFLLQFPRLTSVGSDSDSDDEKDPGRVISRMNHKHKHTAKTKKRERVLKHKVHNLKRKFDKEFQEETAMEKQQIDPVRLLQDPTGFAERLLAKLHKTTERFEVRMLIMSVLARVISEHEVILPGVFPLLERYLEPSQLHSTNILALASTCVHRKVPPEALTSLVRAVANRFVNDRSDSDAITIGINTIREICKRQPEAMNPDLLADLVEYKQRRGEKGVIMAARALLQLYREVDPAMLPAKMRGSKSGPADTENRPRYGAEAPLRDIPGLEALFGADGDIANQDDLQDMLPGDDDTSSGSGDWVDVSHSDDDEDAFSDSVDEDDDDAVPQLVPISAPRTRGSPKAGAAKPAPASDSDDEEDDEEDDDMSFEGEWEFADEGEEADDEADEEDSFDDDELDSDDDDVAERPAVAARAARKPKRNSNGFVDEDDIWLTDDDGNADADDAAPVRRQRAQPARKAHRSEVDSDIAESDSDAIEDSDDEEESEEGEWEEVSQDSDEDDDDDDDEDDEEVDDSEEAEFEGEWTFTDEKKAAKKAALMLPPSPQQRPKAGKKAPPASKPAAAGGDSDSDGVDFIEDASTARHTSSIVPGSSAMTGTSVAMSRVLDDADFEKLRKIRDGVPLTKAARNTEKEQRNERRNKLLFGTGAKGELLDATTLESFTSKKRERDREKKVAEAVAKRGGNNFDARKKKKTKLITTHREKQKVGKLYQMTKRSGRVAEKIKRSVEDRNERKKDMAKKGRKFRIARGWKA